MQDLYHQQEYGIQSWGLADIQELSLLQSGGGLRDPVWEDQGTE